MSHPALTAGEWQELSRLLADVADMRNERGIPFGVSHRAGEFLPKLALRVKALTPANQPHRAPRGESSTGRHKRILREVRERDCGCTAKGFLDIRCQGMLETDHQWGRGREEETVENMRQLCGRHHRLKTDSHPSRIAWLENFRSHAFRHGYQDEVAKAEGALALEHAQHPEHREAANG